MKLKTLIASASLVLGFSSIALAQPAVTYSASAPGAYGAAVVSGHRLDDNCDPRTGAPLAAPVNYNSYGGYDNGYNGYDGWNTGLRGWRTPPISRAVTLASDVRFPSYGQSEIRVGTGAGRFDAVQISADGGRTFLRQVAVEFTDGRMQVVGDINRTLVGNQAYTLDLDGNRRAIKRVIVYTSQNPQVRRWNSGAFNVIAL